MFLPFGHGIDIVENSRIEFDDINFASRYMTKKELDYLDKKCKNNFSKKMYMIGIWAIKESIVKAMNHNVIFSDIEINITSEAPECIINGYKLYISLSYEQNYTIASTIAYELIYEHN